MDQARHYQEFLETSDEELAYNLTQYLTREEEDSVTDSKLTEILDTASRNFITKEDFLNRKIIKI